MTFISGVNPHLCARADTTPLRSECGTGALMPWAGKLWMVSYVSHTSRSGSGTGLYEIDENLTMRKHPDSVVGTYANRMIHGPSDQLVIGPHLIDARGHVRTLHDIREHRLTATLEHPEDPVNQVCFLTMEGLLLAVNLHTLEVKQLFNLIQDIPLPEGAQPHFKGGYTTDSRIIVTNNTYTEKDFEGTYSGGYLAEWDGREWRILERTAFMEVWGRKNLGNIIYATGWDRASVLLKVLAKGQWSTYRLPKPTQAFDHYWQTEWMRIREVEHERLLLDSHGMFYELTPAAYSGKVWGVRPICTHLRVVPDFCSWRGFLVLGGNQVSPAMELHWWKQDRRELENRPGQAAEAEGIAVRTDNNPLAGEPQAGLWFGKTDDLWQFGKPKGWGGPWWDKQVAADQPSEPYLMTGFDQKVLHLYHDASKQVDFRVEVDFLGNQTWKVYASVPVPAGKYVHHEFPAGFSAHWVRVTADTTCTATAYFHYT